MNKDEQQKRYKNYKDSGIQWLGEVPAHWEVKRLRYLATFSKGLNITKDNLIDDGIPCVNYGEIHSKYGFEVNPSIHALKFVLEYFLLKNSNCLIKNGDFVFADTSEDVNGSGNFTYLNSEISVFAGYHTIIVRLNKKMVFPRFMAYLFDSDNYRNQIRSIVTGVKVFSIKQIILKNSFICFPPLAEQTAIADYLDKETAKIDALISKQQQLMEKLAEQRTAIISYTVTKGLNSNASMKDSGIQWLGEVPAHWEVKKFKYICKIITGYTPSKNNDDNYASDGYLWIKPDDLDEFTLISDTKEKISDIGLKEKYLIPRGSILVCSIGSIGKIGISKENAITNQQINSFIFNELIDKNFSKYLVYSAKSVFECMVNDTVVKILNATTQKNIFTIIPPLAEQTAIADYLDKEIAKIDRLCDTIKQYIEKLKEYRIALITQVVTGKIKVIAD